MPPDQLRSLGEPAKPAPHRRQRYAQSDRDPAKAALTSPGQQRRADHLSRVQTAQQPDHRQQHMGGPAVPTARPPRANTLMVATTTAQPAAARPTPPAQHATTPRTGQPAHGKRLLDPDRVGFYHQHRCASHHQQGPPELLAQTGRALRVHDTPELAAPTYQAPTPTRGTNPSLSPSPPSLPLLAPYNPIGRVALHQVVLLLLRHQPLPLPPDEQRRCGDPPQVRRVVERDQAIQRAPPDAGGQLEVVANDPVEKRLGQGNVGGAPLELPRELRRHRVLQGSHGRL